MKNIVGIRLREEGGKIYFFDPDNLELKKNDHVVVDTQLGPEYGTVVISKRELSDEQIVHPLKKVVRIATEQDDKKQEDNLKKNKKAFQICKEKITAHKLDMTLVEARYLFDRSKLMFYFTAEERIDFRDLVKDLAAIFKTRIELRQIGVRDQVKRLGGNGPGGRELCCCSFLSDFDTVSIKMAKEQNLSLNASKITGLCGRLMCCLRYEQNVYDDKMKKLPHVGAIVKTEDGEGTVDQVEVLKEIIKVKLQDENENFYFKKFNASDVKIIKDNKRKASSDEELSAEELAELKRIEAMDNYDNKNRTKDDDV